MAVSDALDLFIQITSHQPVISHALILSLN